MKKFSVSLLTLLIIALAATSVLAKSGTLLTCEGISTTAGYQYVGTYCVDYECKFVVRRIFNEYCPYLMPKD